MIAFALLLALAVAQSPTPERRAEDRPAYLVSSNTGALRLHAEDGRHLGDLVPPNNGLLGGPQHMALFEGKVLVCGWFNHLVSVVDLASGELVDQWGVEGARNPAFLRLDPKGAELWVSFVGSDRVVRLDPATGEVRGELWSPGLVAGPHGIDVLDDGSYLVTSSDDGLYRVRAPERAERVATLPLASGRPLNAELLPDGTVVVTAFVADEALGLQRVRLDTGEVLGRFSKIQGLQGDGLLRVGDDELLAVYFGSGAVARYQNDGSFAGYLVAPGSGLVKPNAVLALEPPAERGD